MYFHREERQTCKKLSLRKLEVSLLQYLWSELKEWPPRFETNTVSVISTPFVSYKQAETQSKFFQSLIASESFELTQEEKIIVSRGRNAGASSGGRKRGPKRLYASNSNEKKSANGGPSAYQDSTALEALIGYVYLTDEKRCAELIRFICAELDKMDDEGP